MTATAPAQTTSRAATARSLVDLVDGRASREDIASFLDALPGPQRLAEVKAVGGKKVGKLYDLVAGGPAVTIETFLPAGTRDGQIVIFEGKNSLPSPVSHFQKRFVRQDGKVVGYNHQSTSFVTGPGFFVTTDGDDSHPGELLFDYTQTPPFFPAGFPPYVANTKGLSRLVYKDMKDYCRRVANGIIVGKAYKLGVEQGAWFTLTHI